MKEFDNLNPEEKRSLMEKFLKEGVPVGVTFQQWYELEYLEMSCFNGK